MSCLYIYRKSLAHTAIAVIGLLWSLCLPIEVAVNHSEIPISFQTEEVFSQDTADVHSGSWYDLSVSINDYRSISGGENLHLNNLRNFTRLTEVKMKVLISIFASYKSEKASKQRRIFQLDLNQDNETLSLR